MVVEADIGTYCSLERVARGEGSAADPLGLQRVKERLDVSVVLTGPRAVHAGADACLHRRHLELAAVAMLLHPAC